MYTIRSFTIPELVEQGARHYGRRPALGMVGQEALSYLDLELKTRRVAALLGLFGVKKGDRVALVAENSPDWGVAYFGASRAGAVLVPILTDFTPEQMGNILDHAGASLVFVSRKFLPKVSSRGSRIPLVAVDDFSLLGGPAGSFDLSSTESAERLVHAFATLALPEVAADELAAIVYTSGTTGLSKGVMLSHRNIVWDAWACRSIIILHRIDRCLSILPLAHTYEFTIGFIIPIMQGSSVWYLDKPPTATALLPALKAVRPTIMLSVPLVIEKIYRGKVLPGLEAIGLYKSDFFKPLLEFVAGIKLKKTFGGKVRFFGVGGAPLAADVEAFLRRARFPFAIGYGLTETAPMIAGFFPFTGSYRSTGRFMKGVQGRIANPRPDTGEGEIQVRGPNVTAGYYKDPERTKEIFTEDGWFKTGDLGILDARGQLHVRGRLKTMILGSSGENIYPEEVEAVLNRSPYVQESVVYGDGEGLTALINLKPEVLEELKARFQDGIDSAEMAAATAGKAAGEALHGAEHAVAQLLENIKKEANAKLAAFSRVGKVEHQSEPFEKTPTQKIKRFLYPGPKKDKA